MSLRLTGAELPPPPVPGYTVRTARPAEARHYHKVLRIAFADTAHPMMVTLDEFAAAASIRWEECLVAEADGGGLAAVVMSSGQALDRNEGWVKWLGVLPEHRGRGLATALPRTAFAASARCGRVGVGARGGHGEPDRRLPAVRGAGHDRGVSREHLRARHHPSDVGVRAAPPDAHLARRALAARRRR